MKLYDSTIQQSIIACCLIHFWPSMMPLFSKLFEKAFVQAISSLIHFLFKNTFFSPFWASFTAFLGSKTFIFWKTFSKIRQIPYSCCIVDCEYLLFFKRHWMLTQSCLYSRLCLQLYSHVLLTATTSQSQKKTYNYFQDI